MAQHDYIISNQGFASYRSDHNSSLSAIVSNNSGATEPSTTYAYQWWYDTTTDILKMRNADNDAWITMFTFNQTADTYSLATDVELTITENLDLTGSATISGDLTVDTDTLKVDSTNNRVGVKNASPTVELDVTGEAKISGDLTVDTDTLYVDSANNRVGVGTTSPATTHHIVGGSRLQRPGGNSFEWAISSGGSYFLTDITNASERMRIDNSGNVGIGTSSPTSGGGLTLSSSTTGQGFIDFKHTVDGDSGIIGNAKALFTGATTNQFAVRGGTNGVAFGVGATERMRIDSSGNLLVHKTAVSVSTNGVYVQQSTGQLGCTATNDTPLEVNRLGNDGVLVQFRQASTPEGAINVSGANVTLAGFTGSHWSRLSDNSKPTILKGTILESLDEMMDWYQVQFDITETDDEGNETTRTEKQSYALGNGESVGDVITYNYEGTDYQATIIQEDDIKHTKSKISDTIDSKNVYGIFFDWDNDDNTVNDMYVAQTGTFVVRINGSETVSKGDLIQSNGDGTGKVQSDDIIRASTVAKVISSTKVETYDDGSYIVPCTLHC